MCNFKLSKFIMTLTALIFTFSLFSVVAGATLESDVSTIRSDVNSIKGYQSNLYSEVRSVDTTLTNIYSRLGNISGYVDGIESYLSTANTDLSNIYSRLGVISTNITNLVNYCNNISSNSTAIYNLLTGISSSVNSASNNLMSISDDVSGLKDFFVSVEHKNLENSAVSSVVAATSIYSSAPNGSSTSQNLGALGGFSSDISENLDTGVSAGSLFSIFSSGSDGDDGSIFGFFSTRAMTDMDSSLNSRGVTKSSSSGDEVVTNYYGHNADVFNGLLFGDLNGK